MTYTTFGRKHSKGKREQLRGEREASNMGINRKSKEANELQDKMMLYPKGSKEYKKLEQNFIKKVSLATAKLKKKKKM